MNTTAEIAVFASAKSQDAQNAGVQPSYTFGADGLTGIQPTQPAISPGGQPVQAVQRQIDVGWRGPGRGGRRGPAQLRRPDRAQHPAPRRAFIRVVTKPV